MYKKGRRYGVRTQRSCKEMDCYECAIELADKLMSEGTKTYVIDYEKNEIIYGNYFKWGSKKEGNKIYYDSFEKKAFAISDQVYPVESEYVDDDGIIEYLKSDGSILSIESGIDIYEIEDEGGETKLALQDKNGNWFEVWKDEDELFKAKISTIKKEAYLEFDERERKFKAKVIKPFEDQEVEFNVGDEINLLEASFDSDFYYTSDGYQIPKTNVSLQYVKEASKKIAQEGEEERHFLEFGSAEEFQDYIRENEECPDVIKIGGVIYTMDEYDSSGKTISYANIRLNEALFVRTENRYKYGFKDAVVVEDVLVSYRPGFPYLD